MGIEVVKGLFEKINIDFGEVEFVICVIVIFDMVFLDMVNIIVDEIGMKNVFCYDIYVVCLGFFYVLIIVVCFIEVGVYKKVVVIGVDKMFFIVDYIDWIICVIFGDGVGVVMLEVIEELVGVMDFLFKSDGFGWVYLYQKVGGFCYLVIVEMVANWEYFVFQNGCLVFKVVVFGMLDVVIQVMACNNLMNDDIVWLVFYQANKCIIEMVVCMVDFLMEWVMVNIQKYGNMIVVILLFCLWDWEDQFQKGDNIILIVFGGGFIWGVIYIKWVY